MSRLYLVPYKAGSRSARDLARAIGAKRIRTRNSSYRWRMGDKIINWGYAGEVPATWIHPHLHVMLNHPWCVRHARDKRLTFECMQRAGVPTVEWTTERAVAEGWLSDGHDVFVRHSTKGQGGSGIEVVFGGEPPQPCPAAPLYTKRWAAAHEYRIHVCHDDFRVTKKRRRNGVPRSDVRNHANGYVYCTRNVRAPDAAVEVARKAVFALGLDFGAVDLLVNDAGEARVLEVNTAPGLEGSTLAWYATALNEALYGPIGE